MKKTVELSVRDFRAIKHADIAIDGITVVAGVNGCGKSTLSKLLYYILHETNAYENLAVSYFNNQAQPYFNLLEQMQYRVIMHKGFSSIGLGRHLRFAGLPGMEQADLFMNNVRDLCDRFWEYTRKTSGDYEISERLEWILRSTTRSSTSHSTREMLDMLILQMNDLLDEAKKINLERPIRILKNNLSEIFNTNFPRNIVLKEWGDPIIGEGVNNVPILHSVKKVAYIDTPMVIGMPTNSQQPGYWKEINTLLKNPPQRGYKRTINDLIKKNIQGDASFSDDFFDGGFKYKRWDGQEFDLMECATGIKSFAMLQLLLKNRFIDENTLLIIDEPEAHLHPQWIVEYARIIILLHKRIGVKFFIASHSTDMVSAIRYLAEKEKCLNSLGFYVAEEHTTGSSTYSFRSLGHDIDPIFESFNKSFQQLDSYINNQR